MTLNYAREQLKGYQHLLAQHDQGRVIMMHPSRKPDVVVTCLSEHIVRVECGDAIGAVKWPDFDLVDLERMSSAVTIVDHYQRSAASYDEACAFNPGPALVWNGRDAAMDLDQLSQMSQHGVIREMTKPEHQQDAARIDWLHQDAAITRVIAEEFGNDYPWNDEWAFWERIKGLYESDDVPDHLRGVGFRRSSHCLWVLASIERATQLIALHVRYEMRSQRYA